MHGPLKLARAIIVGTRGIPPRITQKSLIIVHHANAKSSCGDLSELQLQGRQAAKVLSGGCACTPLNLCDFLITVIAHYFAPL